MVAALPLILAGSSALSAGVSLVDMLTRDSQFKNVGATGAQQQALGLQTQNVARLQSQTGMSPADVQKVQQVQQGQQQQSMQAISALQQSNLSSFDRQRIAEALTAEVQKQQKRSQDVLGLLDIGQEAKRLTAASQATAAMAAQAEQIRAAEAQKAILQAKERQQRAESIVNIFGSLGKTAALGYMGMAEENENLSLKDEENINLSLKDEEFSYYGSGVSTNEILQQPAMTVDVTQPIGQDLALINGYRSREGFGLGLTQDETYGLY